MDVPAQGQSVGREQILSYSVFCSVRALSGLGGAQTVGRAVSSDHDSDVHLVQKHLHRCTQNDV